MIDWNKPIRWAAAPKSPLHLVGLNMRGNPVVQSHETGGLMVLSKEGKYGALQVENVPDRRSKFANVWSSKGIGSASYATRDAANQGAKYAGIQRKAVIEYVFEGDDLIETIIHKDV